MGAPESQYLMGELRRTGNGEMVQRMRLAMDRKYGPQVKSFRDRYPDAPSDKEYDYLQMAYEGKLPDPDKLNPEMGMVFLPEEGYIEARTDRWQLGKPLSFDVNSGTYQFPQAMSRMVAKGAQGVAKSGLYLLSFMDPESNRGDISRDQFIKEVLPDGFEELETNYGSSFGAALENFGGVMTEMMFDMLITKGAGMRMSGKNSPVSFNPSKFKSWAGGLQNRLRDATAPGVLAGEALFLANPSNMEADTMTAMAVDGLREMGFEGELVDALEKIVDHPAGKWAFGIMEGAALWEAARFTTLGTGRMLRSKAAQIYAAAHDGLQKLTKPVEATP